MPLENTEALMNNDQCDTGDAGSTAHVDSLIHPATSLSDEPVKEEFYGALVYSDIQKSRPDETLKPATTCEHNMNSHIDNMDC